MTDLFHNMEPLLKSFWYVAIPTSLVFIIQTILTFVGVDATDSAESIEHDSSSYFSLRNLINFLMGFSFAGITFYNTLSNKTLLIAWALVVGLFFVWIFLFIIRQIQKLSEDNTFELTKTLYERAEVYLTIPENKKGKGKIIISIKGSVRELEAMTENESLPSGSLVKVVGIENNILIVESL